MNNMKKMAEHTCAYEMIVVLSAKRIHEVVRASCQGGGGDFGFECQAGSVGKELTFSKEFNKKEPECPSEPEIVFMCLIAGIGVVPLRGMTFRVADDRIGGGISSPAPVGGWPGREVGGLNRHGHALNEVEV